MQKDLKSDIPVTWESPRLGSVYQVVGGGTPSTSNDRYWNGTIPWITSADINGVRAIHVGRYVTPEGVNESATTEVPGRTLLVVTRVGLGKIAISEGPICFSQDLQGLVQDPSLILPEYGLHFLSYEMQRLKFEGRGTTISGITTKQLKDVLFPLPPYREQERIVTKIEELLSELDKGAENLHIARAQLEAYRHALLTSAFSGELTGPWRGSHPDQVLTPDELLEKVATEHDYYERERLSAWKEKVEIWKDGGEEGRRPSKPRTPRIPVQPSPEELDLLDPLPLGYVYTYLANLGELARGRSRHRPRNAPELFGGPYPFIQTGEVRAATRVVREYSQTYSETGLEQSKLWPKGTLCITIAANIAETAFLEFDACFPDSVVGFTANEALVLPEYVELFIKSVQARINSFAPATAQKNINLRTLENLIVPLCSLQEQRVIVDRLGSAISVAAQLETEIDNGLARTRGLRQAILKRAFGGELVAQDAADEPASVLLERIREQRKGHRNTKKERKAAS